MIRWSIEKHAEAFPTRVIAQNGYPYIFNVAPSRAVDQGEFIKRGAYRSIDLYDMAEATKFNGVVLEQAPNGNYYIEVTDPGTAQGTLWVYNVPMIAEEYNREFTDEKNYFNRGPVKNSQGQIIEDGDILRAYQLTVGDVIELSVEGFEGWDASGFTAPKKGDSVTLSSDADYVGKLAIV